MRTEHKHSEHSSGNILNRYVNNQGEPLRAAPSPVTQMQLAAVYLRTSSPSFAGGENKKHMEEKEI